MRPRLAANEVVFASYPMIESIRPYQPTNYVGWEMAVPDQYRADVFIRELQEYEKRGEFPNLVVICLPNDHTSGTKAGTPTPAACMADNDLAFGRIVEAIDRQDKAVLTTGGPIFYDRLVLAMGADPVRGRWRS